MVFKAWVRVTSFVVVGLLLGSTVNGQGIPSWKNGTPIFDGKGYQLPTPMPSPPTPPSSTPSVGADALSLPPDSPAAAALTAPGGLGPSLNELPMNWDNDFGLSPMPLDSPILDSPAANSIMSDSSVSTANYASTIEGGQSIDTPPLEEEVVRWYQRPWIWMTRGWDNHAELGLDGSNGNAETFAFQTGLEMKRKTDDYTLALDFDYRQASASDVITEDNGRFNLDYDRLFEDSAWALFGKFGMEFDTFKAFDLRLNLNSGVGYHWIRNDTTTLVTRFGAGASKEIGAPDDDWKPEAVFGIEADHQLTSRQKVKAKVDYFPAWADFSDYRLVTDVAWETLLSDSDNFSLRLSLTDRYDSTPQGALANDVYYSALLLYKF